MPSIMFDTGIEAVMTGVIDLDTSDIRVLLLKSAFPTDKTLDYVSDLTPATNECDATNYARGTLASKTVSTVSGYQVFDAADQVFSTLGNGTNNTIVGAVIYLYNASDSAAQLLCAIDFGNKTTDGTDFTIQWSTNGIFRINNN